MNSPTEPQNEFPSDVNKQAALEKKLFELESKTEIELIRRESRLIPVLIGLIKHVRFNNLQTDEKSHAALSAFFWRIFSPGTAATAGGIFVIILTAAQVSMIWEQNKKIDQQTQLIQAQVNVALTSQLGGIIEDITANAKEYPCLTSATLKAIKAHSDDGLSSCWVNLTDNERQQWLHCESWQNALNGDQETSKLDDLKNKCLSSENIERNDPSRIQLSEPLFSRILTFTKMCRPYRFIASEPSELLTASPAKNPSSKLLASVLDVFHSSDSPILFSRPLSPERGVLLSHVLAHGFNIENSFIGEPNWAGAYAPNINAGGAQLPGTLKDGFFPNGLFIASKVNKLINSDFKCASFAWANMEKSIVLGGDFSGINFMNALLPKAEDFSPDSLIESNFDGAVSTEEHFLEIVKAKKIQGFNAERWKTTPLGFWENGVRIQKYVIQVFDSKINTLISRSDYCQNFK